MSTDSVLDTRVRGVNQAHQYANELHPRLVAVLTPFVGEKVLKAGEQLTARVQQKIDELDLPNSVRLHVYYSRSAYCLRWTVKTCECTNGHGYYYEASVTVGEVERGVLTRLNPAPQYRTDYSATTVTHARLRYKEAKRAADEAHNALYPFGESDR